MLLKATSCVLATALCIQRLKSSSFLPSSPLPGALASDPINHRALRAPACRRTLSRGPVLTLEIFLWNLAILWRASNPGEREGPGPQQRISGCLKKP